MSGIIFYTNPMSRGRIVRWMLEELVQPYETRVLDYGPQMKSPDYLAINPMGKVPTVQHGHTVVTEAAALKWPHGPLSRHLHWTGIGALLGHRADR